MHFKRPSWADNPEDFAPAAMRRRSRKMKESEEEEDDDHYDAFEDNDVDDADAHPRFSIHGNRNRNGARKPFRPYDEYDDDTDALSGEHESEPTTMRKPFPGEYEEFAPPPPSSSISHRQQQQQQLQQRRRAKQDMHLQSEEEEEEEELAIPGATTTTTTTTTGEKRETAPQLAAEPTSLENLIFEGKREWVMVKVGDSVDDYQAPGEKPSRLDTFLTRRLGATRTYIQHLITEGHVKVDGKVTKEKNAPIKVGQTILAFMEARHDESKQLQLHNTATANIAGDANGAEAIHHAQPATATATEPPVSFTQEQLDLIRLIDQHVIHEDDHILVLNKPEGFALHAGKANSYENSLHKAVRDRCLYYWQQKQKQQQQQQQQQQHLPPLHVGFPHRLDKETSGVIVCAKNTYTLQALSKQFADHTTKKVYCAVSVVPKNFPVADEFIIDVPLIKRQERMHMHSSDNVEFFYGSDDVRDESEEQLVNNSEIKHSKSMCKVVAVNERARLCLLAIQIKTGRTHQIRTHLSSIGLPVCGDIVYAKSDRLAYNLAVRSGARRMMLHSRKLGFVHPITNQAFEFVAPLPPDMKELIDKYFEDGMAMLDSFA